MKVFYRKKYINCDLNNQFSLFFVVASNIQSVQQIKLVDLRDKNYLEKGDILFINFNKFIMNEPASILDIAYSLERTQGKSDSSIKKFKNIKINLGLKILPLLNEKFLFYLAFS